MEKHNFFLLRRILNGQYFFISLPKCYLLMVIGWELLGGQVNYSSGRSYRTMTAKLESTIE